MIKFPDSFDQERGIDLCYTADGRYVNFTIHTPYKSNFGANFQMPAAVYEVFKEHVNNLKIKEEK